MTWDADRGNGILELCHAPDPAEVGERDQQTGLWPVRISHTEPTAPRREGKHIVTTKTGGVLHILTCERCGKGFKAMDETARLCHDCKAAESRKRAGRRTARRVLVDGVEYASMGKAAKAIGCTMPAVREALDKGRTSIKGFRIEEVRPSSGQVAAK